jgi:hypothetical protein
MASQPALALQATVRSVWHTREMGYRQALAAGDSLVQLAIDENELSEGQRVFKSGKRIDWDLR